MLSLHSEPTVASVFAPRTTIDPDGTEGYASLFGEIDQARDMVMRGAFADTLASRGIRRIPMLFQHDSSEPVGIWLEPREDFRGLFARGRELISLLRAGGDRWPLYRLPCIQSAHRSENAHPPPARGRPLGNFHRHFPAARGSARARGEACDLKGEAVMRPHACRAGVGEDNRRSAPAVN